MSNKRERISLTIKTDHREMLDEIVDNHPHIESRSRMVELMIRMWYDDSKHEAHHG